jgi:NADPH-dependent glutamate synthase beta subunit-like oxidoreductase
MKYFERKNPTNFEEASALLKEADGTARLLSGGTDILSVCKDHILPEYPKVLVNLKNIPGYEKIEKHEDRLVLGAGAKLNKVAELHDYNALAQAARSVASPLIRPLATVGGNICQDTRCWYYRYPDSIGGAIHCMRKGGPSCYAVNGENRYHSIFGGVAVSQSACRKSCPAGTDISGYLQAVRDGDVEKAAQIIMQYNPMPMLTSRICPHPCQDHCNQCNYGDGVNVHALERSVGDYILLNLNKYYSAPERETGVKTAVIGAGPSGLSAAYYLRNAGHSVTIYDKMEKAGGVLTYGIPHYRLPKKHVDAFVKALGNMGVIFKLNVEIGKDILLEDIKAEYERIYLGTGAWKQPVIGLDGENLTYFGLNFLIEVNTYLKKSVGNKVLVCGGGNVAVDVALTAARLGAKSVKLICLEKEDEMPASAEEITRAREENIQILNGWGLSKVFTDDIGKVRGLEAKKCVSVFDAQGRFSPAYDENEKLTIDSDYIILATGQRVSLDFLGETFNEKLKSARGLIQADLETYETAVDGFYAGGDAVTGPDIAIRAIAAGRIAAESINSNYDKISNLKEDYVSLKRFDREGIQKRQACMQKELPPAKRTLTDEDVVSLTWEETLAEAGRCLNCGCYAVNPSDLAPVLIMHSAEIVTTERVIPAKQFFKASSIPGFLYPGEVVKEVIMPKIKGFTYYDKNRVRDGIDFATVSLASLFVIKNGLIKNTRLVFGGIGPYPYEPEEAEMFLIGKEITGQIAKEVSKLAINGTCVMDKNEHKTLIMKYLLENAVIRAKQSKES